MTQSSPNYQEFIEEQEPQTDLGTLSKHPPEIESLIDPIRKSDTYYLFIRDRQLFNMKGRGDRLKLYMKCYGKLQFSP